MKNIKIIIFTITSILLASCSNFLDLKTESNILAKEFNKNGDEILVSLVGCYNGMQQAHYREWAVTELRSDNTRIYARSSTTAIFEVIRQLDLSTTNSINYLVDEYWSGNYHNIARCNEVLRDINVVTDDALRAEYEGETMFIRAYHYFNLVRLFGGVLLVDRPITAKEGRLLERSSPDAIYDFIEADLTRIINEAMLPEVRKTEELGRVTLLAAKSILAKLYMTRYSVGSSDYNKAKVLLEDVIVAVGAPQTAGDLVPFKDVFSASHEMNKEIIFTIRYKAGNLGIGSPFGNDFAPAGSGSNVINGAGRSYNYPSTSIINAFNEEAGDLRKDISLAEKYYNSQTGSWVDDDESTQCRYVTKYFNPVTTVNDGESDWPVIRVADILLLYAELANETEGPTATAVNYVNIIRERAGLPALDPLKTANPYSFRKALRNERRLELAFENHRWFDLLRWGAATTQVNEHYDDELIYTKLPNNYRPTMVEWQTVLPIPLNIMNVNQDLTQNIGY